MNFAFHSYGGMFRLWTDEQLQDLKNLSGSVIWQSMFARHFSRKEQLLSQLVDERKRGFAPDRNPDFAPPFLTREGYIKLKVYYCHTYFFVETKSKMLNVVGHVHSYITNSMYTPPLKHRISLKEL